MSLRKLPAIQDFEGQQIVSPAAVIKIIKDTIDVLIRTHDELHAKASQNDEDRILLARLQKSIDAARFFKAEFERPAQEPIALVKFATNAVSFLYSAYTALTQSQSVVKKKSDVQKTQAVDKKDEQQNKSPSVQDVQEGVNKFHLEVKQVCESDAFPGDAKFTEIFLQILNNPKFYPLVNKDSDLAQLINLFFSLNIPKCKQLNPQMRCKVTPDLAWMKEYGIAIDSNVEADKKDAKQDSSQADKWLQTAIDNAGMFQVQETANEFRNACLALRENPKFDQIKAIADRFLKGIDEILNWKSLFWKNRPDPYFQALFSIMSRDFPNKMEKEWQKDLQKIGFYFLVRWWKTLFENNADIGAVLVNKLDEAVNVARITNQFINQFLPLIKQEERQFIFFKILISWYRIVNATVAAFKRENDSRFQPFIDQLSSMLTVFQGIRFSVEDFLPRVMQDSQYNNGHVTFRPASPRAQAGVAATSQAALRPDLASGPR